MSRLEEAFADELVVVGVHSGKFIAERDTDNIRAATRRLGMAHPVVNDRQFRTWRAFNVQAWPTVVLVGPDGQYIGQHSGEFSFDDFSSVIQVAIDSYSQSGLLSSKPLHLSPDPEPPSEALLRFPGKVLCDAPGNRLFIADTGHHRILVVSMDGERAEITQIIGSGRAGFQDGSFSSAQLRAPEGMALHEETLYIADTENHSVRAADLTGGTVTTVAGNGEQGSYRSGGKGTQALLNSPWDLLAHDGHLYIAMSGSHQLWQMDLSTSEVGPFVGSGRESIEDGPNPRATLAQPSGLATDGSRLLFADSESSALRAADFLPTGYTQTLLGEGLFEFGDRDGKGMGMVRLQHCLGVTYHDGTVYIADTYNNKIKRYNMQSKECLTALGSGEPSELYEPGGVDVWPGEDGATLYIADTNNHRVLASRINSEVSLLPAVPLRLSFSG
ncbi:MAG: alkyl hydroperoxide reductase [Chloroflexota bacterium]|nr:alkyl hydroperoxide reductase [Chloroflexota bacterium]